MDRYLVDLPPFSFWVHESGSGVPVILIHGLGGSSDWWRHNISTLAGEYRVMAVDLVGFGRNRLFLRRSKLPLGFAQIASLHVGARAARSRPIADAGHSPRARPFSRRSDLLVATHASTTSPIARPDAPATSSSFTVGSVVLALASNDEFLGGVAADEDEKRNAEADQRHSPLTRAARDTK